ncbi:MAG: Fe-S cluster assembly protein SufD, partial [Aliifodinibius sp.]|nr:SufD family Fe-S cluster assembly protein [Fodinibius sp.]NIV16698.1 Fe-S cluster assembly protein SufD [Fodinibius sp.]NIY30265.1 Fe-S cluster assembly protein SufD [Fodinibius sp.]
RKAYHLHALETYQQKGSIYSLVNIDMGGALVRNNLNITIDEEHGESHIIGFYMGTKKQHIDNHTLIRHLKPNCYSNELYKGILGGKATGVF